MQQLTSILELSTQFSCFVFDIWGVVHDGVRLFPGVSEVFATLKQQGKTVGLLSNSPRTAASAAHNLQQRFGLAPAAYDHLVTSGQIAFEAATEALAAQLGKTAYLIGPAHLFEAYAAAGFKRAAAIETATFILAADLDDDAQDFKAYQKVLQAGAQRGLPLLCCNPDHGTIFGDEAIMCIGALADYYAQLGGTTYNHYGKPHAIAFHTLLTRCGAAPGAAVMIGDNLATDIAGAAAHGMKTAFMVSGMARPHLAIAWGAWPNPAALTAFLAASKQQPDYALVRL